MRTAVSAGRLMSAFTLCGHSEPMIEANLKGGYQLRFQPVDATHSLNFSAGE